MDTLIPSSADLAGDPALVSRAEALRPIVEAASTEIEDGRRLPPALLDKLHEAQLFRLLLPRSFGGFAIVGPYAAEVWPSHLRTTGMGSAYGFGGIGKIIGPVGLALIVGSQNYLKPDVPLTQIPTAFLYLGCWFLMAGVVYYFFGLETKGKSLEQIDRELAAAD